MLCRLRDEGGTPPVPGARRRLLTRIARSPRLEQGRLDLGVEAGEGLVGHVEARQPSEAFPPGVFELGISLLPEARGRGLGTEAVVLLCEHLFDYLGAARIQASTSEANGAMRRVLEKAGFAFEGRLRGFMPALDGRREDYVLYAVTLVDWRAGRLRR